MDSNEDAPDFGQRLDAYWFRLIGFLSRPQSLLALVVLVFVATRVWLLLAPKAELADTYYYAYVARRGIDNGEVVYRDFEVCYPPVAWWLMDVPRWLDSQTYKEFATPESIHQFLDSYFKWYHFEMLLADTACLVLMWAIGRKILPAASWALPAAYTLLTIAQPSVIYDRLDLVLLLFFLLAIDCWLRSLTASPAAYGWTLASYLFLGLGISFKVVPLACVPYLLLADLWARWGVWNFAGLVLALLTGALSPFLVHMPSAGWQVFSLFQFHAERDTHLESIWASAMLVASAAFGVPCSVVNAHGGYDLVGPWSGTLKTMSGVAILAMGACLGLWALLRGKRFDRRLALDSALLALVNSTVLSAVFSPQYLNWMLPLGLMVAISVFPRSLAVWSAFALLAVAVVGISSWLFPYHYLSDLTALRPLAASLSVTRSACLVALALLLDVCFFMKYGMNPRRVPAPAPAELA